MRITFLWFKTKQLAQRSQPTMGLFFLYFLTFCRLNDPFEVKQSLMEMFGLCINMTASAEKLLKETPGLGCVTILAACS